MPTREEISYFGAGPAPLPTPIIESGGRAFVNFNDTGLGLSEISHRSPTANKILAEAKEALTKLYDIPDDYEILFMQGGGSGEFSATLFNFVGFWVEKKRQALIKRGVEGDKLVSELSREVESHMKVDYLVTGSWSLKASQEAARLLGEEYVNIVTDSRKENDGKFGSIPDESTWKLSRTPAMTYFCDNETVDGVEFPGFPKVFSKKDGEEPIIVADMSSNILSRRIPISKYSAIFFGAQKNLGVTGVTVVIIRKSLLPPSLNMPPAKLMRQLGLPIGPIVLDYATIAKNNSLYNTLSIFDVYVAGQVLQHLLSTFPNKVDGQEALADQKAALLYAALDAFPDLYRVVPHKSARSRMNICFNINSSNSNAEKDFLSGAKKAGLEGLKGHRSVGGIRASNYNSIPLEGAKALVEYLKKFAEVEAERRDR